MIRNLLRVELDLRSLAALRVTLALLVLLDVLSRCRDLSVFYTDEGALPRVVLLQIPHPTYMSFFMTAGTRVGASFWMAALALSAFGLLIGWNTRWCSVATWVLHIALKHRNPLILHAGDLELGLILWWAIFLPLGARYSVDSRANPEWKELPDTYASVATTGYLLQITLVYAMAALNKTDPVWWRSGLALYYCFSCDQFATPIGQALSHHLVLLRYLTFTALVWEAAIPLLLWVPWKRKVFRNLACVAILLFHLGIGLTLNLGLMVLMNVGVCVGLWPGSLFRRAGHKNWLPKFSAPRRADCPAYLLSRPVRLFLAALCFYVCYLNLAVYTATVVPLPLKLFGYFTRQQQEWKLFAPHPGKTDGWFVARGETVEGKEIDLLRGGAPVDFMKPVSVSASFPNQRWRLWLLNLVHRSDPLVNESFASWLARSWNRSHPGPAAVKTVTIFFVSEPTPLPDQPVTATPTVLFHFDCPEALYKSPDKVFLPLDLPSPPNPE